jgi:hypothetical protein
VTCSFARAVEGRKERRKDRKRYLSSGNYKIPNFFNLFYMPAMPGVGTIIIYTSQITGLRVRGIK